MVLVEHQGEELEKEQDRISEKFHRNCPPRLPSRHLLLSST
jgi:hypothetical protein